MSSLLEVEVTVGDVNDNPQIFPNAVYNGSVVEVGTFMNWGSNILHCTLNPKQVSSQKKKKNLKFLSRHCHFLNSL